MDKVVIDSILNRIPELKSHGVRKLKVTSDSLEFELYTADQQTVQQTVQKTVPFTISEMVTDNRESIEPKKTGDSTEDDLDFYHLD